MKRNSSTKKPSLSSKAYAFRLDVIFAKDLEIMADGMDLSPNELSKRIVKWFLSVPNELPIELMKEEKGVLKKRRSY